MSARVDSITACELLSIRYTQLFDISQVSEEYNVESAVITTYIYRVFLICESKYYSKKVIEKNNLLKLFVVSNNSF